MTEDEKTDYLASYNAWRTPPPLGWYSMENLPLRAREVELLFEDGNIDHWGVSNAVFLTAPEYPVAWRNALYTADIFRRRVLAWASSADEAGLWAVLHAIKRHEAQS